MNQYAIIMPIASGKTTITHRFNRFVDVDELLNRQQKETLSNYRTQARITSSWVEYNKIYYSMIASEWDNVQPWNSGRLRILLLHGKGLADYLGLRVLATIVPSQRQMNVNLLSRGANTELRNMAYENRDDVMINDKNYLEYNSFDELDDILRVLLQGILSTSD
jgi:hypothetical protein